MKKIKKAISIGLIAGMLLLSACNSGEETKKTNNQVFSYGSYKIYEDEYMVYANTVCEEYEENYGNEIWDIVIKESDGNNTTVEAMTKRDIIEQIKMVKTLVSKAEDYSVILNAEEIDTINKQVEDFYSGLTDADIEASGITKDLANQVFTENAIANKVYNEVLMENTFEISDEDARQTTIYDLLFQTYTVESDGSSTPMTDEEKGEQYDKAVEALGKLIPEDEDETAADIETLAVEYDAKYSNEYTMSKEEYIDQFGQNYADTMYTLADNGYSQIIETDYGYHIIMMRDLTNADATKEKKESMMAEKEKEYFQKIYEGWVDKIDGNYSYTRNVDEDVLDSIKFGE